MFSSYGNTSTDGYNIDFPAINRPFTLSITSGVFGFLTVIISFIDQMRDSDFVKALDKGSGGASRPFTTIVFGSAAFFSMVLSNVLQTW